MYLLSDFLVLLFLYLLRLAFHALLFLRNSTLGRIHRGMEYIVRDYFPPPTWDFYLHRYRLFFIPLSSQFSPLNLLLQLFIHSSLLPKNLRPKILSREGNISSLVLSILQFAIAFISCRLVLACSRLIRNRPYCLVFFIRMLVELCCIVMLAFIRTLKDFCLLRGVL